MGTLYVWKPPNVDSFGPLGAKKLSCSPPLLILQDANVCSPAVGLILVYFVSANCWWVVPKIYKLSTYV